MDRIRKGLYLMAGIWMLLLPMQAAAAGEDAVSLIQEEDRVAVVLEMGNAQQEKISAVSVSLQVNEESRDKVKAEFDFTGELAGATTGSFYNESTGALDIYAASGQSLFDGEILNLGYVRVTLKDSGQILPVEISYRDASFHSANEVYGEKMPMITSIPEPVNMQVGEGAAYVVSTEILEKWLAQAGNCKREDYSDAGWENLQKAIREAGTLLAKGDLSQEEVNAMVENLRQMIANVGNGTGGGTSGGSPGSGGTGSSGNAGAGSGTGGSDGSGSQAESGSSNSGSSAEGNGSMDDGLNDENTQLVNDPSSAQKITSSVIRGDAAHTQLVDMSQQAAAASGTVRTGGSKKWTQSGNKVSVVSPENGPSSIFISKGDGTSPESLEGEGNGEGQAEDAGGGDLLGESGGGFPDDGSAGGEEILLDRKNGGVQKTDEGNGKRVLMIAGIIILVAGGLGVLIFVLVKGKEGPSGKRKGSSGKGTSKRKAGGRKASGKNISGKKTGGKKPSGKKPVKRQ